MRKQLQNLLLENVAEKQQGNGKVWFPEVSNVTRN